MYVLAMLTVGPGVMPAVAAWLFLTAGPCRASHQTLVVLLTTSEIDDPDPRARMY
jgi:hypothetical protein